MPELTGYHHVSVTVVDVSKSAAWWTDVLGFEVFRRFERDGMTKVILRHPGCGIIFGLTSHGARSSGGTFSEFRTGMDHLAFAVPGRADLEGWKARFAERGVVHSDITQSPFGELIAFRDPDNIAYEVYADVASEG